MKKLKRTIAVLTLAIAFVFGTAPLMTVRADGGPQGTSESKSKGLFVFSNDTSKLAMRQSFVGCESNES